MGSLEQSRTRYYNPYQPLVLGDLVRAGKLAPEKLRELGDVVAGKAAGRKRPEDQVVYHDTQGGFGDVALCAAVYTEARRRGLGQEIVF